jgi:hypothetical protein
MTDIEYLIHGIALDSGCWMEDTGNMVTDNIDLVAFSKSLAKLAAQVERESCAKLCDYVYDNIVTDEHIKDMAFKIRARGQA